MPQLDIRQTNAAELMACPNLQDLISEYAAESAVKGLPQAQANFEMYKRLELVGALKFFGAFSGEALIGLITLLTTPLPHYVERVATIESFFVFKEFRETGAGLKLLAAAKAMAKEIGAVGLLVSAPIGGQLCQMLEAKRSFTETNRSFFTGLN